MKECVQPGSKIVYCFSFKFILLYFRTSQLELKQCIESLSEELKKISETQQNTIDLDLYVKKLINAKQRVTVLTNVLQNAQERLNKVHMSIEKETIRRKIILKGTIEDSQPSSSS